MAQGPDRARPLRGALTNAMLYTETSQLVQPPELAGLGSARLTSEATTRRNAAHMQQHPQEYPDAVAAVKQYIQSGTKVASACHYVMEQPQTLPTTMSPLLQHVVGDENDMLTFRTSTHRLPAGVLTIASQDVRQVPRHAAAGSSPTSSVSLSSSLPLPQDAPSSASASASPSSSSTTVSASASGAIMEAVAAAASITGALQPSRVQTVRQDLDAGVRAFEARVQHTLLLLQEHHAGGAVPTCGALHNRIVNELPPEVEALTLDGDAVGRVAKHALHTLLVQVLTPLMHACVRPALGPKANKVSQGVTDQIAVGMCAARSALLIMGSPHAPRDVLVDDVMHACVALVQTHVTNTLKPVLLALGKHAPPDHVSQLVGHVCVVLQCLGATMQRTHLVDEHVACITSCLLPCFAHAQFKDVHAYIVPIIAAIVAAYDNHREQVFVELLNALEHATPAHNLPSNPSKCVRPYTALIVSMVHACAADTDGPSPDIKDDPDGAQPEPMNTSTDAAKAPQMAYPEAETVIVPFVMQWHLRAFPKKSTKEAKHFEKLLTDLVDDLWQLTSEPEWPGAEAVLYYVWAVLCRGPCSEHTVVQMGQMAAGIFRQQQIHEKEAHKLSFPLVPSDGGEVKVVDASCSCNKGYHGTPMKACRACMRWFHEECVKTDDLGADSTGAWHCSDCQQLDGLQLGLEDDSDATTRLLKDPRLIDEDGKGFVDACTQQGHFLLNYLRHAERQGWQGCREARNYMAAMVAAAQPSAGDADASAPSPRTNGVLQKGLRYFPRDHTQVVMREFASKRLLFLQEGKQNAFKRALQYILTACSASSWKVRRRGIEALGEVVVVEPRWLGNERVYTCIMQRLQEEPVATVRCTVVKLLSKHVRKSSTQIVKHLLTACSDEAPSVRSQAIKCLHELAMQHVNHVDLCSDICRKVLLSCLNDPMESVKTAALNMLFTLWFSERPFSGAHVSMHANQDESALDVNTRCNMIMASLCFLPPGNSPPILAELFTKLMTLLLDRKKEGPPVTKMASLMCSHLIQHIISIMEDPSHSDPSKALEPPLRLVSLLCQSLPLAVAPHTGELARLLPVAGAARTHLLDALSRVMPHVVEGTHVQRDELTALLADLWKLVSPNPALYALQPSAARAWAAVMRVTGEQAHVWPRLVSSLSELLVGSALLERDAGSGSRTLAIKLAGHIGCLAQLMRNYDFDAPACRAAALEAGFADGQGRASAAAVCPNTCPASWHDICFGRIHYTFVFVVLHLRTKLCAAFPKCDEAVVASLVSTWPGHTICLQMCDPMVRTLLASKATGNTKRVLRVLAGVRDYLTALETRFVGAQFGKSTKGRARAAAEARATAKKTALQQAARKGGRRRRKRAVEATATATASASTTTPTTTTDQASPLSASSSSSSSDSSTSSSQSSSSSESDSSEEALEVVTPDLLPSGHRVKSVSTYVQENLVPLVVSQCTHPSAHVRLMVVRILDKVLGQTLMHHFEGVAPLMALSASPEAEVRNAANEVLLSTLMDSRGVDILQRFRAGLRQAFELLTSMAAAAAADSGAAGAAAAIAVDPVVDGSQAFVGPLYQGFGDNSIPPLNKIVDGLLWDLQDAAVPGSVVAIRATTTSGEEGSESVQDAHHWCAYLAFVARCAAFMPWTCRQVPHCLVGRVNRHCASNKVSIMEDVQRAVEARGDEALQVHALKAGNALLFMLRLQAFVLDRWPLEAGENLIDATTLHGGRTACKVPSFDKSTTLFTPCYDVGELLGILQRLIDGDEPTPRARRRAKGKKKARPKRTRRGRDADEEAAEAAAVQGEGGPGEGAVVGDTSRESDAAATTEEPMPRRSTRRRRS